MQFKLRTKPTQFVRGKTEETLSDIMVRWEENQLLSTSNQDKDIDEKLHLIDIIVTNNSLLETEMWLYRTKNKFNSEHQEVKIHILSSKSNDFRDIHSYINDIQQCSQIADLPNVLIVCYHKKRVCSDIVTLCKTFGGKHRMILPNIDIKTMLKFHVSFDEPDANIGVTRNFLQQINPFIINKTIEGVLFITATPLEQFWDMLSDSGINTLLNINKDSIHNFDDDLKCYMSFKDHNICIHDNNSLNPLSYIGDIFEKNLISNQIRRIVFAPGHLYTEKIGVGSHDEIQNYFLARNYTVLKINGTFKGFIYPNPNGPVEITLDDYNFQNNIKGELRDTLRHWSLNNSNVNLAITGYWVIERGVTFNTDNFNFTDVILSNYHLKNLAKLIQLEGRTAGNKNFVDKMNVFCTSEIKETVNKYCEAHEKICSDNPPLFTRNDFVTNKSKTPVQPLIPKDSYRIYSQDIIRDACKLLGYQFRNIKPGKGGFVETSLNKVKQIASLTDAIDKVPTAYGTNNNIITYRTCYPCYLDIKDPSTLVYVLIIRPNTSPDKLAILDSTYHQIKI